MKVKSINNTQIFINFSKRDMEYLNTINVSNMKCIHIFITDTDYNYMCSNNEGLIPLIEQTKLFSKVKIVIHSFDIRGEYSKKKNVRKYLHDFENHYQLEGCSWIDFCSTDERFEVYHNKLDQFQTEITKRDKKRDSVITIYDKKGRY